MIALDWIRQWALSLELSFIHRFSFLRGIPLLRRIHRNITADVRVLGAKGNAAPGFVVRFKTPYLNLPVAVEKSQVGFDSVEPAFTPAAFRFFDWHSWVHIQGDIEWHGMRWVKINGERCAVISGFTYTICDICGPPENFGLRLAEGVEGTVRVLWNHRIVRVRFEPLYWMLEPKNNTWNVVAIKDSELVTLIVSLSEIGSGNPRVYDKAVKRLEEWTKFKLEKKRPERALLEFLRYVRDWGPLGMEPLFPGLVEVLEHFHLVDKERILFDFFADNWGVRNNRLGRLLVVRILEALGTENALFALEAIANYVKHQSIPPEEIEYIESAIRRTGGN